MPNSTKLTVFVTSDTLSAVVLAQRTLNLSLCTAYYAGTSSWIRGACAMGNMYLRELPSCSVPQCEWPVSAQTLRFIGATKVLIKRHL